MLTMHAAHCIFLVISSSTSRRHLPLLLPTPFLAIGSSAWVSHHVLIIVIFLFFVFVGMLRVNRSTLMLARGHPQARLTIIQRLILRGEIDRLTMVTTNALLATLRESTSAGAELRLDGGVLSDPVGKSIFAVLDDTG